MKMMRSKNRMRVFYSPLVLLLVSWMAVSCRSEQFFDAPTTGANTKELTLVMKVPGQSLSRTRAIEEKSEIGRAHV